MLMGIFSGAIIRAYTTPTTISAWADNITLLTDLFLRLIKTAIAPLVFSTLTANIMRLGETATISRVNGKAMVWFITSLVLSIPTRLVIVTFQHLGTGLNLAVPEEVVDTDLMVSGTSPKGFPSYTIPTSITEATADNKILRVVVLPMFFGIADVSPDEKFNAPLVTAFSVVPHITLRVTGYVMYVTPLAIFTAILSVTASQGLGILLSYASFIGGHHLAVLSTSAVLIAVDYMVLKKEVLRLLNMLENPVLVASTTGSSETAYPRTLKWPMKFGYSCNTVSSVLPIGCSFNLAGSMVYCSFATMFIAQTYNVPLSFSEITVVMLTLTLASKDVTGVPRSALAVLAVTVPSFNIPVAGILLLMGIDHFLDMGRFAIDVLGNGITTATLSKNEGLLTDEEVQPD